jgi:hypothetical protein
MSSENIQYKGGTTEAQRTQRKNQFFVFKTNDFLRVLCASVVPFVSFSFLEIADRTSITQ